MSRRNNENEEPREEPEVYFVGGRLRRDSVSAGGFEAFMLATLAIWVSAVLFFFRFGYEIKLEDPDLGITASVSATLAGLALAFLTLIYQLSPRDRFLKLGFSFLTFVLLVSTIFVVGAMAVSERTFDARPRVEVWFVSSALLVLPLLLRHVVKDEAWSKVERVLYTLPYLVPFPLVWSISERRLLTASVLLLALGVIGLPVLMAVFVYGTLREQPEETAEERFFMASAERWQRRLDREKHFEELKERLRDILESKRAGHGKSFDFDPDRDTDEYLVTAEELNSHPELREESRALIDRALDDLADSKKIYSEGYPRRYYLAPTPAEIDEAVNYFRAHPVVVFRVKEGSNVASKDLHIVKDLATEFHYPRSVVVEYLLEPVRQMLRGECLPYETVYPNWEIYVKRDGDGPRRCLALWDTWYRRNYDLAVAAGMKIPAGEVPDHTSIKWYLQREITGQAWEAVVRGDPALAALIETEVLPENFQTGLDRTVDLHDFFENLENLLPDVRKAAAEDGGNGAS